MKKLLMLVFVLVMMISIAGCSGGGTAEDTPTAKPDGNNTEVVSVNGRIIEIVEGAHILIRNEKDTKIYYKLDTSGGLVLADGVNESLSPDNVISADVQMVDAEALPKETVLMKITANKVPDYRVINSEQAKAMIDEGDVLIVDVRTVEEYNDGYIPDAYNVPLDQIEAGIGNVSSSKDDTILVYCRSGNRSKVAARILTEMGYTNVYDFGGIVDWPYDIYEP